MKNKLILTTFAFIFFGTILASAQNDSTRKGHFLFGANLFGFSAGQAYDYLYQNSFPIPPNTTNYSIFSASFQLKAGYFVSNTVCIGLNFGDQENMYIETFGNGFTNPLYSSLMPSSFFFRYYLNKDDYNIASFSLEGAIGGAYNSISLNGTGTPANVANLNSNLNIVISIHIIKHLNAQLAAGISYNVNYFSNPPYNYREYETINSIAFNSALGLQYKL